MTWIKCSEQMPEARKPVIVYALVGYSWEINRERKIYIAYWHHEFIHMEWFVDCDCSGPALDRCRFDVTHWMPLPEPPEEK